MFCETLERRTLFTTAVVSGTGTLLVTGTTDADVISVSRRGSRIEVRANDFAEAQIFQRAAVRRIVIDGLDGDDTLSNKSGKRGTIVGGAGEDTLFSSNNNDFFMPGGGSNSVLANAIHSQISYSDLSSGSSSGKIEFFEVTKLTTGPDFFSVVKNYWEDIQPVGSDWIETLSGSTIEFTPTSDVVSFRFDQLGLQLDGGSGDDKLEVVGFGRFEGSVTLIGNAGDDTIVGGAGNDSIVGGDGNDLLEGGAGNDVLYGSAGNDTLIGGTGRDYLSGGGGADRLDSRDTSFIDTLFGGAGSDRARVDNTDTIDLVSQVESLL